MARFPSTDLQDSPVSRRTLLAGGLTVPLMLAGCGKAAGSSKIRFGHTSAALAVSAAAMKGLFVKHGLDVELIQVQSGPAAVAATVGGSLDFTFGDFLGWVSALSNGFTNCQLVSPANGNGNLAIVARKGIDSPAQLVGKRIGVLSAPMFSLSVKLWLKQIGIDPDSVHLVIVGDGAEHILGRGDIDALLAFDPVIYQAEHRYGARVIAGDPSEAAMPKGAGRACYYVNGDFLKAKPEIVDRVVAAVHEGARLFATASAVEKARINAPYTGLSPAKMQKEMPGLIDRFRYAPTQLAAFDLAANQAWVDLAFKEGALKTRVDIKPYVYASAFKPA